MIHCITKLIKGDGTVVATYTYNAWGKILGVKDANGNAITADTHVALINPFRYRGYIYDDESGLYYLQSRYYDPTTGRFVNADVYTDTLSGTTLSANMFAYCENDPVGCVDYEGQKKKYIVYKINKYVSLTNFDQNKLFNCYAFALRRNYGTPRPGDFCKSKVKYGSDVAYLDVNKLANLVIQDLKALKYKAYILTGRDASPNYVTGKNYYLIALRITSKAVYQKNRYYDFHFMRRTIEGCWRFKSGICGDVMQLNGKYTPSNVTWDTYYIPGNSQTKYKVATSQRYTSAIIYIKVSYKKIK